jgi:hypothetical protein
MSKIDALRDLLVALLLEHERDGTIPTNARFLFYELVQRGQISKEKTGVRRADQNLHDALIDVREDGRIPWDRIVDETKSLENYTGYPTVFQKPELFSRSLFNMARRRSSSSMRRRRSSASC